ncbi:MAG: hypothetical protein ACOC6S_03680 [Chloroflexota bacterium]
MGERLTTYFDKAKEKGGAAAAVKLAMITKMSSQQAKEAEDSDENIKKFEEAIAQI